MEPLISALLVWILGMQSFPGIITWIGTLIVIPGMILITIGQSKINSAKNQKYIEIELSEKKNDLERTRDQSITNITVIDP